MISMLFQSVGYPWFGQVKPQTIGLVFAAFVLSTYHYGVRAKTGLAQNQDNVSEQSDMSTCRQLFQ